MTMEGYRQNVCLEVLTTEEMYRADALAVENGVSSLDLMETAGRCVAEEILTRFDRPVATVLCGPGNNGGDGFVIARHLQQAGSDVTVAMLGDRAALKGDAAVMAKRWEGSLEPLREGCGAAADVVVDALFGAGLRRDIQGDVCATLRFLEDTGVPIVAVDMPSGIDGNTGQVRGFAPKAALTVSFFRPKPGHLLLPGRLHCGELRIVDIGIPEKVLDSIRPQCFHNNPELWTSLFPRPLEDGHKYSRGHAVVLSGPRHKTGAARLAARAALRSGAGLVTIGSHVDAAAENAGQITSIMLHAYGPEEYDTPGFPDVIGDPRRNAVLLGPAAGVGAETAKNVQAAFELEKAVVLDADALTSFQDRPESLFKAIRGECILTPHDGEFARLFAVDGSKLERCRAAAALSGAVVLLKGSDTVIAAPDGRAAINNNAPAHLATAGAGDVLAGICVGLLAQHVPAFEAACMAAWMHGDAARRFGPGLIAEDLPEVLPSVIAGLSRP